MENKVVESLRKQALDKGVSLAEFCRWMLRESSQMARIEELIGNLDSKLTVVEKGEF